MAEKKGDRGRLGIGSEGCEHNRLVFPSSLTTPPNYSPVPHTKNPERYALFPSNAFFDRRRHCVNCLDQRRRHRDPHCGAAPSARRACHHFCLTSTRVAAARASRPARWTPPMRSLQPGVVAWLSLPVGATAGRGDCTRAIPRHAGGSTRADPACRGARASVRPSTDHMSRAVVGASKARSPSAVAAAPAAALPGSGPHAASTAPQPKTRRR